MFKTEELTVKIELLDKLLDYNKKKQLNIDNAIDLVCNLRAKYKKQLDDLKEVHNSIENS